MPTLISAVLMLDLLTTGQGCNETESAGRVMGMQGEEGGGPQGGGG